MNITACLTTVTILVLLYFTIYLFVITTKAKTDIEGAKQLRKKLLIKNCILISLILLVWAMFHIALFKGMQPKTTSLKDFQEGFLITPFEDTLPEDDQLGKLIVYYRYDCPNCHSVMKDIQKALEDYPVYYICSRSEQGIRLRETYPVSDVPAIIYTQINQPGWHYSAPLAIQNGDSGVMLNTEGLNKILESYEKKY